MYLADTAKRSSTLFYKLLVQADDGCTVCTVKIVAEQQLLDGEWRVFEALDHLFKLFRMCGIEYGEWTEFFVHLLGSGMLWNETIEESTTNYRWANIADKPERLDLKTLEWMVMNIMKSRLH